MWVSSVLYEQSVFKMWYGGYGGNYGYAEDFSQIAHSDSLSLNCSYAIPGTDLLQMQTKIINPHEHLLTTYAIIESQDETVRDSLELHEGIPDASHYGTDWSVPAGENFYTVVAYTKDTQANTLHDGELWNRAKFTTAGPVVILDTIIVNTGNNQFSFRVRLKNMGQTKTIPRVTARITTSGTNVVFITNKVPNLGNIAPGDTATSTLCSFQLAKMDLIETYPITLEILSDGVVYWEDVSDLVVGIKEGHSAVPTKFALDQNYPNPFNPLTAIGYQLPAVSQVELAIYDVLGQKVAILVYERQQAGEYQVQWDASGFASGIYYYQLVAGEYREVRKMILLR